jgi:hypothetical protein
MSGFDQPNYTMVPNKLFELMPRMKEAELRVTLAIVRQTFGYIDADTGKRKAEDELSLTQLEHKTGLSRQAVVNGTSQGLERGTLARRPVGNSFAYHLVLSTVVNEVDQSTKLTSQASRPKAVNEVDRQVVNEVDTQKKDLKEKKEKRETQPQALQAQHRIFSSKQSARPAATTGRKPRLPPKSAAWSPPTGRSSPKCKRPPNRSPRFGRGSLSTISVAGRASARRRP